MGAELWGTALGAYSVLFFNCTSEVAVIALQVLCRAS